MHVKKQITSRFRQRGPSVPSIKTSTATSTPHPAHKLTEALASELSVGQRKMKESEWTNVQGVHDLELGFKSLYFLNGQHAYRYPIQSHATNHFAGYTLMEKDIRNMKDWLKELTKIQKENGDPLTVEGDQPIQGDKTKNIIAKGLFIALITVYGKLFTQAKGRLVSLNRSIFSDSKLIAQHDELIKLRHNYTAHSGDEKIERCEVVVALAVKDRGIHHRVYTELGQPNHYSLDSYKEVRKLLTFLHNHVKKRKEKAYEKVKNKHLTGEEIESAIELHLKYSK